MNSAGPLVGILMGSDSDWPKIKAVGVALREFDVPYEVRVMSAHRTPGLVTDYASSAVQRGLKVIIAGSGKSLQRNFTFLQELRLLPGYNMN